MAVRGVLCGFDQSGEPLVDFPANGNRGPVAAMTTVSVAEKDKGKEVILLFEDGDPARPIIVGIRQCATGASAPKPEDPQPLTLEVDGQRLVYTAQREIVLRCGKASIQLLSDGSVRIRGTNVLSRASATNRIRGGNIQIN
jgi:hypothetical protein